MTLPLTLASWLSGPRAPELLFPMLALPVAGLLLAPLVGARGARVLALLCLAVGLVLALACAWALMVAQAPLIYALGGWAAPLGVELRLDGPAALMLVLTAALLLLIGLHAAPEFSVRVVGPRATLTFWTLLLGVWAGLNGLFLGRDLFNLYVAIEVLTFSAVPMVCLKGGGAQLQAAFRYLLFALLGSALYLLGAGLMYGIHGSLDMAQIRTVLDGIGEPGSVPGDPIRATSLAAVALMSTGLIAKTALMPLHLWLPPAHGGAPAPASALLSALVVKGSFFLLFRLWLDLVPTGALAGPGLNVGVVLGGLGVFAIVLGNLMALMQERLKLLVAYSTLAQLGYLFLLFPLAQGVSGGVAATAALVQVISHALAKASLFLVAGRVLAACGHDRLTELGGFGRTLPATLVVILLAGLALVGLPPSGGYLVKALYGQALTDLGAWWWRPGLELGGLLSAAYLARILWIAMRPVEAPRQTAAGSGPLTAPAAGLLVPGLLALAALLLGLAPPAWFALMDIARPDMDSVGAVATTTQSALTPGIFWSSVGPSALTMLLVVLLLGAGDSLWRRRLARAGRVVAGFDAWLREWRTAGAFLAALLLIQALAAMK